MTKGKVNPEDVPPYDHPPAYDSLFPTETSQGSTRLLDAMRFVNEVVISPVTAQSTSEETRLQSQNFEVGTSV